jgi:TonB family protein
MSRPRILVLFLLLVPVPLCPQSGGSASAGTEKTNSQSTSSKPEVSHESASSAATTSPASDSGDSTVLKAIYAPNAVYPRKAADENIQGQVWVKLSISETGDVEKVDVVSGNPILADAAVEAYKKWKFRPYIKGGKPVKVSVKLPMDFAARDQIKDTVPPTDSGAEKSVHLSAATLEGMLIHKVTPLYPNGARLQQIQGTVLLWATIGKDGRVKKLVPISGPDALIPAAIGAVQQWRYVPYIMNNEPVEANAEITVNFKLQH